MSKKMTVEIDTSALEAFINAAIAAAEALQTFPQAAAQAAEKLQAAVASGGLAAEHYEADYAAWKRKSAACAELEEDPGRQSIEALDALADQQAKQSQERERKRWAAAKRAAVCGCEECTAQRLAAAGVETEDEYNAAYAAWKRKGEEINEAAREEDEQTFWDEMQIKGDGRFRP